MKIIKVWFSGDYLYGEDDKGMSYRQSLLWYKNLRNATEEDRAQYTFGVDGIHWRKLDEDVSFESFTYEDAEPTSLQRFFLTHPEINVTELSKIIGMSPLALRSYINGARKPSKECEQRIINKINAIRERVCRFVLRQLAEPMRLADILIAMLTHVFCLRYMLLSAQKVP